MDRIQLLAFVAAIVLAVVFCLCFGLSGVTADTPSEKIVLDNKINPNNASAASLARLPGIGLTRAQAVISYREQFRQSGRGVPLSAGREAFRDCNDLDKVKGIGPATAHDMCEYLKFQ